MLVSHRSGIVGTEVYVHLLITILYMTLTIMHQKQWKDIRDRYAQQE
jgi:hypothetical protein